MHSLYKGVSGLENLECRKSHLPHFLGLFFIFLFSVNQFSLFFSAILENFQVILYILSPQYSLISNFIAYYSLISIKNGHYSLISKPHPDPHLASCFVEKCIINLFLSLHAF